MPTKLIGIYAKYKEDTNIIASWLASCARLCGYPTEKLTRGSWDLDSSTEATKPSGHQKGKARQQATQASTSTATPPTQAKPYILAVADFVPLADFIVRSTKPTISISPAVVSILDRAISARSNFGRLLGMQQDIELDTESDSTHKHFVGILEKVRKILVSKMLSSSSTTDKVEVFEDLSNRFSGLEIQQPSQNADNAEPRRQLAAEMDDYVATKDTTGYIAEEPSSFSDALAAYCMLIHDIKTIRETIKHIWTGVRNGTIDYAAAAIAADAAVGMIRDLEDTVSGVMEPHGGILNMMLEVDKRCTTEEGEPLHHDQDRYQLLLDHCVVPILLLYRLLKAFTADNTVSYLSLFDFSDEDKMYGVGWWPDIRWLNLCVADCTMLAECLEADRRNYPAKDMLVQGVQDMTRARVIPFYAIVAAQINLDIHHVLGKKTEDVTRKALREMSEMQKDASSYLDCHDEDAHLGYQLKLLSYVLADPLKQMKDIARRPNIPAAHPHQTLKLLPVLTGQMVHQFRVSNYQDAVRIASESGSIQYAVQLYHALRTEGLVKTEWPDLDHARTMLGESNFFLGSPPKSIPEYMSKFCLHAGLSPAALARQGRSKKKKKTRTQARETDRSQYTSAGPRIIANGEDRLPLSKKFVKLYESRWNREREAWSREFLRDILGTVNIEPIQHSKREDGPRSSRSQGEEGDSRLRCVLLKLTEALHDESRSLHFPVLKLHETSWEFLTTVRDKCGPILRAYFRDPDFQDDEVTWFIAGYIFSAACRAGDKNRVGLPLKQSPDLRPLKLAGEVCERLLTSRKDFGTRALKWMEEKEQDAREQELEYTRVENKDIEDTGPSDGLEDTSSSVTGPNHAVSGNTGSEDKEVENTEAGVAGVESKGVEDTAFDTNQVEEEGTTNIAVTDFKKTLSVDITAVDRDEYG
ncbi:hypothetical protein QBC32DRAFT_365795 [Pseudoneurospora amorphoporcata]|uniref:DUF6604 domain-containing protein n=1 Tax=Pseudoneurospora amorphoporcata TaxID=241081 RepID=A0AAN6SBS8_9PEZI|nr:hypothetical protein QBC32DRAFT_365795 [Pseudoneurospora amorphoporcata]